MFDTHVTVVGNVLTAPEARHTANTHTLVATFKVAATARRLDRSRNCWVDGNSFRVRVICWRKLAEGVLSSVEVGDPVVVVGRLYTRDWVDSEGTLRTLYELEASAVGHDLSRGRARFVRNRPRTATSASDDAATDAQEEAEAAPAAQTSEPPAGSAARAATASTDAQTVAGGEAMAEPAAEPAGEPVGEPSAEPGRR
ncbi:MAG: single-stranded DNA-binding protein [Actinobacteria bacterium]|nr:MAG: single-stranded DNA-binding protein [Actinomycetota bacterium]